MVVALRGSYPEALDYLFARTTGAFRFGLERTEALLAELGEPHRSYPVLHVAGTNGKGSCVHTADALLRARGLRVARYTSPHLVDFRERIVVDGAAIGEAEVVAFIERWTPAVERIGASFFEATTAMAFAHFARMGVDVALVETGLGGRLDSTNVVTPLAALVTSIGYDHTEWLGETLEQIAAEKAGIFKHGIPAVIGEQDAAVAAWLATAARAAGSSPVDVVRERTTISGIDVRADGTRFVRHGPHGAVALHTPLVGRHQATNLVSTLAWLDAAGAPYRVSAAEAQAALPSIRLPGRFQRTGHWIFDVAHNTDGARTLAQSLRSLPEAHPARVLLCVLGDKDWRGMMDALAPVASEFVLTNAPSAPPARRWTLEDALQHARARGYAAMAEGDFDRALERVGRSGDVVLVTGSFHTVGDAMARLQVSPLGG